MAKFYFTYGTSRQYDYQGGWTEVEASDMGTACAAFRAYHPDKSKGIMNCGLVYTEELFKATKMYTEGNLGAYCHERIALVRECSEVSDMLQERSTDLKGEQHD